MAPPAVRSLTHLRTVAGLVAWLRCDLGNRDNLGNRELPANTRAPAAAFQGRLAWEAVAGEIRGSVLEKLRRAGGVHISSTMETGPGCPPCDGAGWRPLAVAALLIMAAATIGVVTGCRRDDSYCDGAHCLCGNQPTCDVGCDQGCDVTCTATDACVLSCGDDCQVSCHGNSTCQAELGKRGHYLCQDVSDCAASLSEGGTATCNRVSACHITCLGTCQATCTQASTCDITCAGGAAATPCAAASGTFACGMSC